jgi:hypothetical protein
MLKTLKITTILIVAVAALMMILLLFIGLQPDPEMEELLDSPDAIARFKARSGTTQQDKDKTSPLVSQGKKFSLRLDPPPPPQPQVEQRLTDAQTRSSGPEPPPVPRSVQAKFDLMATCRYKDSPGKSLALIKLPAEGMKWVRPGDKIGYFTVEQVGDGSMVYSREGDIAEITVPINPSDKQLLKDPENDKPQYLKELEQEKQDFASQALEEIKSKFGRRDVESTASEPPTEVSRGRIPTSATAAGKRTSGATGSDATASAGTGAATSTGAPEASSAGVSPFDTTSSASEARSRRLDRSRARTSAASSSERRPVPVRRPARPATILPDRPTAELPSITKNGVKMKTPAEQIKSVDDSISKVQKLMQGSDGSEGSEGFQQLLKMLEEEKKMLKERQSK